MLTPEDFYNLNAGYNEFLTKLPWSVGTINLDQTSGAAPAVVPPQSAPDINVTVQAPEQTPQMMFQQPQQPQQRTTQPQIRGGITTVRPSWAGGVTQGLPWETKETPWTKPIPVQQSNQRNTVPVQQWNRQHDNTYRGGQNLDWSL